MRLIKHIVICVLIGLLKKCNAKSEPLPGDTTADCFTTKKKTGTCFHYYSTYRSYDGTCNNPDHWSWGATDTIFKRVLAPSYSDERKVMLPRGFLDAKDNSPPVSKISEDLFSVETWNLGNKYRLSTLYMTFGQFLDHDLVESAHGSCKRGCSWVHPCFPIMSEDGASQSCTAFSRSKAACQKGKNYYELKPREQVNILTSYIDGSQIYGVSIPQARSLRSFKSNRAGELRTVKGGLLPIINKDNCEQKRAGCSLVGDSRGDENIALLSMHTLWVREHNRIARKLRKITGWGPNKVFHEARKIVGAMLQHIVYKEYLKPITKLKKYKGYDKTENPSIINGFAAAAFRYGHSLIPEFFQQLNKNYKEIRLPFSLREVFFNTKPVREFGIEPTMFGLIGSQANTVDRGFCESVSRKLFIKPKEKGHQDLTSLNMQRGRDHGLPTYGRWRKLCRLPKIKNWRQLIKWMPESAMKKFKSLYKHPNDIDLYAAGVSERHLKGLAIGPTFACIFRKQFTALRDGDRFYYENKEMYTPQQIREIKKVTMARVLCNNLRGKNKRIQRYAFYVSNKYNKRVSCKKIKGINLEVWVKHARSSQDEMVPSHDDIEQVGDIKNNTDEAKPNEFEIGTEAFDDDENEDLDELVEMEESNKTHNDITDSSADDTNKSDITSSKTEEFSFKDFELEK